MSGGVELDGKTKRSSLLARTGVGVDPSDAYVAPYTSSTKELNLHPETTINFVNLSRNMDGGTITARSTTVYQGYAYVGPSLKTINKFALSAYSPHDSINLEKGTDSGKSELLLETGYYAILEEGESWPTHTTDWNNIRFTGTNNTSVDGETIRLGDIAGSTSTDRIKTNIAFPCEVIQYTT